MVHVGEWLGAETETNMGGRMPWLFPAFC
jgi:hypothetical protein